MRFFLFILLLSSSYLLGSEILVSVAPQKYVVQKISGELFTIGLIVPPAASPHTYEPTPKQMADVAEGKIWFRIGEGFEKKLLGCLKNTMIVDAREGIDLLEAAPCCRKTCDAHDPHIWLSPTILKKMAEQTTEVLSAYDPKNASLFRHNLCKLCEELDLLDGEISLLLADRKGALILVSHPAFGYFCRDYELRQLSIEMDGKEPSPRYITELLAQSRNERVRSIYLQKQYSRRSGECIAKELGAQIFFLDPYAENVVENLREIAMAFREYH